MYFYLFSTTEIRNCHVKFSCPLLFTGFNRDSSLQHAMLVSETKLPLHMSRRMLTHTKLQDFNCK